MRKRSMSVAFERNSNTEELTKKFEGVASEPDGTDTDGENDDLASYTVGTNWTSVEYNTLVQQLQAVLPSKDARKPEYRMNAIDWTTVAFDDHSPDEVKKVAQMLMKKIRKFRTLAEMLEDVPNVLRKFNGTGRPKNPPSAYNFFIKEKFGFFKERNPNMHASEVLKLASQEFQILSEKKKRKYLKQAEDAKEEHKKQMEQFYRDFPSARNEKKTSRKNKPKASRATTITPYNLYVQEKRSNGSTAPNAELRKEWEKVTMQDKLKYISEAFKEGGTHPTKLSKAEKNLLDQAHGKPESIAHSCAEHYLKYFADTNTKLTVNEWRKQKLSEFKSLPKLRKLQIEIDFHQKKQKFVKTYEEYISNLTDEDQQHAEIEFLQTFINTKMSKTDRQDYSSRSLRGLGEDNGNTSVDLTELPLAESTTREVPKTKTKPKKFKEPAPVSDESVPLPKLNVFPKPLKSILKSPSPVVASPKRKPEEEIVTVSPTPVKKKKLAYESESDSSAVKSGKKKQTNKANADESPVVVKSKEKKINGYFVTEPEAPAETALDHFRKCYYLGKEGKHKEAFLKLPEHRRTSIKTEFRTLRKKYMNEIQKYIQTLPKEKVEIYVHKMREVLQQRKARKKDNNETSEDDLESDSSVPPTKEEPVTSSSSSSSSEDEDK